MPSAWMIQIIGTWQNFIPFRLFCIIIACGIFKVYHFWILPTRFIALTVVELLLHI